MLHDYTTTIPKCCKEVFAISFFEIAARPNMLGELTYWFDEYQVALVKEK